MAASLRVAAASSVALAALAASPIPGFRPPSTPLFVQSPLVNVWTNADAPNQQPNTRWQGGLADVTAAVRVGGAAYLLIGDPAPGWAGAGGLAAAPQTAAAVWATQTRLSFNAGGCAVNVTFTTPALPDDFELLSRPAHYVTFDAACAAAFYLDVSARLVVRDPGALVQWSRVPVTGAGITDTVTALRTGAVTQAPLADTNDLPSWGFVYLLANASDAGTQLALEYANTTRAAFFASGALPAADNAGSPSTLLPSGGSVPATGPQPGVDRGGGDMPGSPFNLPSADPNLCWAACNTTSGCVAWAYGVPNCGGDGATAQCWLKSAETDTSSNACRVSGAQAHTSYAGWPIAAAVVLSPAPSPADGATRAVATIAVDEVLAISWFGEDCPPYWRRTMAVGDAVSVPTDMLAAAYATYAGVKGRCDAFDAAEAATLSAVGGDEYATVAQSTYRQVFGAMQLFWVPSKQDSWYMLKEISSCGCLNTADVAYPAFPQILYYSPELMKKMIVSHLEYAMNYTNQPYPRAWAPHHLGYWPIADLPYDRQEDMPLEETSWMLLQIASIGQREAGDLAWLQPYWPAVQLWYEFLVTLLPFPQKQLSTDDFDGPLYNATNLAIKGVAAIAAYGYILDKYAGDAPGAAAAAATAATYASTMVDYSWVSNGSQSHFMIGYAGSQGDGGEPGSWPMIYNALWLRLLGYDALLPDQATYLDTMRDWYAANQLQRYGLPLNSRKLYTKDDWQTFLAATYFDAGSPGVDPAPSAFSTALFDKLYTFANETTSRVPLSDWTNTDAPTSVGFSARPVYGAMYAPALVARAKHLGLAGAGGQDETVRRLNGVMRDTHARIAAARRK